MDNLGVIIVAGGSGTRMGNATPKQFLLLDSRPVLMHCIERFVGAKKIVVVLPEAEVGRWRELCAEYSFDLEHTIVSGGASRFGSVKNALSQIADCDYVAVQDGVRPFVSDRIIADTLCAAREYGAAIPVVDVTDSLREITKQGSKIAPRSNYKAVQTPQIFAREILVGAYDREFCDSFTDDASVVEAAGYSVFLTLGDSANIKITTPTDLRLADIMLSELAQYQ